MIDSPIEIASRKRDSRRGFRALLVEEGGMEPGKVETVDVCYLGTVLACFTDADTETSKGEVICPGSHLAVLPLAD